MTAEEERRMIDSLKVVGSREAQEMYDRAAARARRDADLARGDAILRERLAQQLRTLAEEIEAGSHSDSFIDALRGALLQKAIADTARRSSPMVAFRGFHMPAERDR